MIKLKKRKSPFLIAELGINHNGSLMLAKELIDLAKKYNFKAVKFQKRDLDICIPEDQKNVMRDTPWGQMTYLNYKKKIEFGKNYNVRFFIGCNWSYKHCFILWFKACSFRYC